MREGPALPDRGAWNRGHPSAALNRWVSLNSSAPIEPFGTVLGGFDAKTIFAKRVHQRAPEIVVVFYYQNFHSCFSQHERDFASLERAIGEGWIIE